MCSRAVPLDRHEKSTAAGMAERGASMLLLCAATGRLLFGTAARAAAGTGHGARGDSGSV
jgi:hypothetical protein